MANRTRIGKSFAMMAGHFTTHLHQPNLPQSIRSRGAQWITAFAVSGYISTRLRHLHSV
jgi:hypothetical protein